MITYTIVGTVALRSRVKKNDAQWLHQINTKVVTFTTFYKINQQKLLPQKLINKKYSEKLKASHS